MNRARRGFALVTVLWLALLLGLMAAALAEVASRAARGARLGGEKVQAEALADLGLARAVWLLKTGGGGVGGGGDDLRADGLVWLQAVPGGRVAIRLVAADALIDLNTATPAVLGDLAQEMARRIGDPDAAAGLQADLLARQGLALEPLDIAEALGERAATRDAVHALAGLVTVGSGRTAPALAAAPGPLLAAVLGLDRDALAALLAARRGGATVPVALPEAYADPQDATAARPRAPVWHIAVAAGADGSRARAGTNWVVTLPLPETRSDRPFHVLARWPLPMDDPAHVALDGE